MFEKLDNIVNKFYEDTDKFIKEIKNNNDSIIGSIVVKKDGSHFYLKDKATYEFESDEDYLVTVNIEKSNLEKIDYCKLNNLK